MTIMVNGHFIYSDSLSVCSHKDHINFLYPLITPKCVQYTCLKLQFVYVGAQELNFHLILNNPSNNLLAQASDFMGL